MVEGDASSQREAGDDDASVSAAGCPKEAPVVGSKCAVETASPCTYADRCAQHPSGQDQYSVQCRLGRWALAPAAYEAKCPIGVPEEGAPCLCGAHSPKACGYEICDVEGDPRLLAICDEKSATWLLVVAECNPPPPSWDAGPRD